MFDRVLNTPRKLDIRQQIKSPFKAFLDWSAVKVLWYLKMRKLELLSYKFNIFFQKFTTCTGLQREQILSVNI